MKIPVSTTAGESMAPLVRELSEGGVQVNVTALFTTAQVELITEAVKDGAPSYISVFAGRIADAGIDPMPIMERAVDIMVDAPRSELIWASPREILNVVQADQVGCHIITVTHDLLKKLDSLGKDLAQFSLETVQMFRRTRSPPASRSDRRDATRVHHRRCRLHRLEPRRPTARGGRRGRDRRRLQDRAPGVRRAAGPDPGVTLHEGDVLDESLLRAAFEGCDWVFHLQANADVRDGLDHPRLDLEQNTTATATVLEAMRAVGCSKIAFSSTGSVYGEPDVFPTPEDAPFPIQTSLYGASKLAGEGLIGAYAHGYGFTSLVFRFVSILGEGYTHGHVFDFYRALKRDPRRLRVLGNGRQEKSYLYVRDCTDAIVTAARAHDQRPGEIGVYNLGTDETVVVDDSIAAICDYLGIEPEREYSGGTRGWAGDSPLIHLDCSRIRALGWLPTLTIREALVRTLEWFDANPWVFETGGTSIERNLRPGTIADLARRRRHRPAVVLLRARWLPGRGRDRQVHLHAGAHGFPAALQDEVLRDRGRRDGRRDPPSDPARDAFAPLARTPAGDRIGRRRPLRHRNGLLRCVHGRAAEGASPCPPDLDDAGRARRGRLRDRDRPAQGAMRQAGPVRGRPRRDLRVHIPPRWQAVDVEPLELAEETLRGLREQLLLFYTGETRSASAVLGDQDTRTKSGDSEMLENLQRTKEMGRESRRLLEAGDLFSYAELMHEHWLNKRRRSPGMASDRIDDLYTLARRSGVVGGKLVGAGGGGFLLLFARNPADTRQAMAAAGATELPFDFEFSGAHSDEYA